MNNIINYLRKGKGKGKDMNGFQAGTSYSALQVRGPNAVSVTIAIFLGAIGFLIAVTGQTPEWVASGVAVIIVAILLAWSIKIASQWEKAIVLRLGKFHSLKGPGMFIIVPIFDTIPYWMDLRVIGTAFKAEQTLTKDNVPVDVDAIIFWRIVDPKKTALEVSDYRSAISWASQTALRDVIGKTELSEMLVGREKIDTSIKDIIDARTEPWGIQVQSVEIRDVLIPAGLQDAMSRQAQAERERQARIILGDSETQIAEKFQEAAKSYVNNPTALHLRAMNMLFEGLKEKGALVIVPSSAVETMGLGAIAGLTSLQKIVAEKEAEEGKA